MCSEDLEAALTYYGHTVNFLRILIEKFKKKYLKTMIGYECMDGVSFRSVGKMGKELYAREDPEVELNSLMNTTPPKLPLEVTVKGGT